MTYAFTHDAPATPAMYREVRAALGDDPPEGLLSHVVVVRDGGLRYIDAWESEADWDRFRTGRLEPAIAAMFAAHGIQPGGPDAAFAPLEVIDVWIGPSASVPAG